MHHLSREELLEHFESLAEQGREAAARHLLACAPCRQRAERVLCGGPDLDDTWPGLPSKPPTPAERQLARRILGAAGAHLEASRADRENAPALARELLARPRAERLSALVDEPAFCSPALAGRLLDRAEAVCERDPAEADHLSALALMIANRLQAPWSTVERESLLGRARCWEAEARRVRMDFPGAEMALSRAFGHFEVLPVGNPERAAYCRHLARLRRGQEREDEALALMARAIERYEELPDLRRAAECRLELAWILLEAMETGEALRAFERVLAESEIDESDFERWLALRHGLALAYADRGREAPARAVLAELAGGAAKRSRVDQLRARLVEAAVAQRLDRREEAMEMLAGAWPELMAEGARHEALVALVDLAALYAETGRSTAIDTLRRRLRAARELPAPCAEALRFGLDFAAAHGPAAAELLEALKLYLDRVRHNPEARFSILLVREEAAPWSGAGRPTLEGVH